LGSFLLVVKPKDDPKLLSPLLSHMYLNLFNNGASGQGRQTEIRPQASPAGRQSSGTAPMADPRNPVLSHPLAWAIGGDTVY
jgi:hypothetical protein